MHRIALWLLTTLLLAGPAGAATWERSTIHPGQESSITLTNADATIA